MVEKAKQACSFIREFRVCMWYNVSVFCTIFSTIFKLTYLITIFCSVQISNSETAKKSTSGRIQIDAKDREAWEIIKQPTNQETRQVTVQLNIVEDDENVSSEPCCAPTDQPFCTPKIWVFNDIETTIRARKCRNPCRILKWIIHLVFWLIVAIALLGCFSLIVGMIGGSLFGIGYLFYLGTWLSYIFGSMGVLIVLLVISLLDKEWGFLDYVTNGWCGRECR